MRISGVIGVVLLAASTCVPAAAQVIPPEVGVKLEAAASPEEDEAFVGTYTVSTRSVIQKPNGKARHELELVMEVRRTADGALERHVVRAVRDGEDATERFAERIERSEAEEREGEDDEDGMAMEPRLPFGDDAALYAVSEPRQEGGLRVATFEPLSEHRDEEGLVEGAIAWVDETLDPAWVEGTALSPPKPLREFWMRMEFDRVGSSLVPTRVWTKGLARVLLFTRQFDVEVLISDIEPAPSSSP